jgi:hypothetical protein
MFETFPLLELQMKELVPYFCKMAMVTNGYLSLDAFGHQMTIRNEILTILAFNSCKICLCLVAPDFFFASLNSCSPFSVIIINDSGAYLQTERFGLKQTKT